MSSPEKCRFCTGSGSVTVDLGGDEKEVSRCINCDGVGSLTCTTCQGSGIQPRYLDRRYECTHLMMFLFSCTTIKMEQIQDTLLCQIVLITTLSYERGTEWHLGKDIVQSHWGVCLAYLPRKLRRKHSGFIFDTLIFSMNREFKDDD